MFIYLKEEDKHIHISFDSDIINTKLETGIYNVEFNGAFYSFAPNKSFEKGKIAEAGVFKNVFNYTRNYFSEEGKRARSMMNQPTRMGLFFKGEPGTGKTFLGAKITLELIEKFDGIGIYTSKLGIDFVKVVDAIRQKDPDRFIVFILDEFEKDYEQINSNQRNKLLAFLDGGNSRDNVMTIATANSLNGIPSTLLERPGRFEKIVEFKITDKVVLENLIQALIPDEMTEDIDYKLIYGMVKDDKDLTIDKLKSIVRDLITGFLIHGKVSVKELIQSIDKEDLRKEARASKKKNRRAKKWVPDFCLVEDVEFQEY